MHHHKRSIIVLTGALAGLSVLSTGCHRRDKDAQTWRGSPEVRPAGDRIVLTSDRAASAGSVTAFDAQVLNDLHRINFVEMQAGQLGIEKGTTNEIRKFADHLVRDHQAADKNVKELARTSGILLASPRANADEQQMLDRLRGVSGADFDREFVYSMQTAHVDAIRAFEDSRASLESDALRDLIADTLPILREHQEHAKMLSGGSGAVIDEE